MGLSSICENIMERAVLKLLPVFVVVFLFVIVPMLLFVAFQTSNEPTFNLVKADWECTDTKTFTYTAMVMVGKVMVPQVHTDNQCVQWRKK